MAEDEASITATLLRAPLQEFTSTRAELARELRRRGDTGLAARIAKLRKPSVALWALNQAASLALDDLETLRETAQALTAAQERVLGGDRSAVDGMRRAARDHRGQVDVLTRRLGMVLGASGHAAPEATLRRIGESLRAASLAGEDTWQALRDGRLTAEPEPSAFPVLDVALAPAAQAEQAALAAEGERKRVDAAEEEVRRAQAIVDAARESEELARRRREQAEVELEVARARLRSAMSPARLRRPYV